MTPVDEKKPDLLPCPFCGGQPTFTKRGVGLPGTMGYDTWHALKCKSCEVVIGDDGRRFRAKDEVAKVWNTRSAQRPTDKDAQEALDKILSFISRADHMQFKEIQEAENIIRRALSAPSREAKLVEALKECRYKAALQSHLNDGAGIMRDIFMIVDNALAAHEKENRHYNSAAANTSFHSDGWRTPSRPKEKAE
jgi:hypothetical protein